MKTTLRFINFHLLKLSWFALLGTLLALFTGSWLLMSKAGETALLAPDVWFYYFVTTTTTVGYGDLSPQTEMGRWVASLLLMPLGITIFAGFLGKLSTLVVDLWRTNMQGKGDYSSLSHHLLILGWHPEKTPRMVELIFGDIRRKDRKVVLCTTQNIENPMPDQVLFIRGERMNDRDLLARAGVTSADRIIVHQNSDDATLACTLSVASLNTKAHIVAWMDQFHMAELLKSHCPQVECQTSISMEMLVRSAQDPGSSRVQEQLLSTLVGPTQYSLLVPKSFAGVSYNRFLTYMKRHHEATVLGIAKTINGDDLVLNPDSKDLVSPGRLVYYMASERIKEDEINWEQAASGR